MRIFAWVEVWYLLSMKTVWEITNSTSSARCPSCNTCFVPVLISESTAEECSPDVGALAARGSRLLILLRRLPGGPPVHPAELQEAGGEGTHWLSWKASKQVEETGKNTRLKKKNSCKAVIKWLWERKKTKNPNKPHSKKDSWCPPPIWLLSVLALCRLWRDLLLGFSSWWFMRYLVHITRTATS